MNRRSFIKTISGFAGLCFGGVAAAFAPKAKSKATMHILPTEKDVDKFSKTWIASKEDITAFSRGDCSFKPDAERHSLVNPPWVVLGCKGCFVQCEHFDLCLNILSDRVKMREALKEPVFPD